MPSGHPGGTVRSVTLVLSLLTFCPPGPPERDVEMATLSAAGRVTHAGTHTVLYGTGVRA